MTIQKNDFFCDFCGKNQREVAKIIAGPGTHICCECVKVCAEIIEVENPGTINIGNLKNDTGFKHEEMAREFINNLKNVEKFDFDNYTHLFNITKTIATHTHKEK